MLAYFTCLILLTQIAPGPLHSVGNLKKRLETHHSKDTVRVQILNELSTQEQWSDFQLSLTYAKEALALAEKLAFKKGSAVAHYRIAHCYWALGDGELAIREALQSAVIAEKENFKNVQAESFRILAMSYRDQKEIGKAKMYISKAEQICMQTKNWDLLSRIYNLSGVIQYSLNENDKALALYNRALVMAVDHHTSDFHLPQIFSNIGEVYGKGRKDNPRLESYFFEKALTLARQTRNRSAEAVILNNMGRVLIRKNHFAEAGQYLTRSLALARELNMKRIIKNIYLTFIDLKVRQGYPEDAAVYVEKYYAVRDSILNEKKTRQIVEMETRFETEKKEQTIRLLEQQRQISRIWTNIWIIGSLFLLTAVAIIYRLQRLRTQKAKQMLAVQKALNHQLTETDQLKSRFFANISHEFRTPLSLILAPVEEMIRSSERVSERNDLRIVRRNANRLLELVNQLLDLSKIDAGKMTLQMQRTGLREFLLVLAASFDSLAETRLISFKKSIQVPDQEAWFDRDKLEKILSNVLSNAFNFTGAGGAVTLTIQPTNNHADLLIEVFDTGQGIPAADLPHVFSAFYQTTRVADEGQPGTGLGLTLVAELVKLHHGKIDLRSEVNVGTSISITIPIQTENLEFEEIKPDPSRKMVRPAAGSGENLIVKPESVRDTIAGSILVVEDSQELRSFIASCFTENYKVYEAHDGEEGLKLAIEKVPDIIISDIMMPKMDGSILTGKIKNDDRTSHIPVILLTAKTDADSRMNGYKLGADDYLAKPFSTEELRVRVTNLIELRKKLASKYRRNILAPIPQEKMISLDDRFMKSLAVIIEANLTDPSFGVEQLAQEMCMSRTQLFRKVKALVDISPNELINDIRLQRAAEMIRVKADSLTQIGYAVGYNEQSYFAKRFRRKFGVSPSEYADN